MRRTAAVLIVVAFLATGLAACATFAPDPNTAPPPTTLAFCYPWFPSAWSQQGMNPFTHYHPSDGFYSSSDTAEAQKQVRELGGAGVQGCIQSWWGQGTATDLAFPAQLAGARGTPFRQTVYYEPEGQGDPSSAQIGDDLTYLHAYTTDPSFLRIDGKPALFVYADGSDGCGMADRWAAAPGRADWFVVLKVFPGYTSCASQPDGWHQYGPAVREDRQGPYSITISPGFWKANESTPRLPRDLSAWRTAVQDMAASPARFHLITTFNEWGEGTAIEPATEWGTAYLDVLHDVLMGGSPSTTTSVSTPTSSTTTTTGPPPSTTTSVPSSTTTTTAPSGGTPCSGARSTVARHVVRVWMENKTYSQVIGNSAAPYTTSLAHGCATLTHLSEVINSVSYPEYLAGTAGSNLGATSDTTFTSLADNVFRQVRTAGGTAREYHEGATACDQVGSGNAKKHEPRLTFVVDSGDAAATCAETPAFSTLDPNNLPTLAEVIPNLCDDMHDCSVGTGDAWLKTHLGAILAGADYRSGNTVVLLMWDEDTPMPNAVIAPQVRPGTVVSTSVSQYGVLKLEEQLLGVPCLANACGQPDVRSSLGL